MSGTEDGAQEKLRAEAAKLHAEAAKIAAETAVLARRPWQQPTVFIPVLLGLAGGFGGLLTAYFTWQIKTSEVATAELATARQVFALEQQKRQLTAETESLERQRVALEQQGRTLRAEAVRLREEIAAVQTATAGQGGSATALAGISSRVETTAAALERARYTVYLHFRGALSRDVLRATQSRIAEAGFRAPGIERIAGDFGNDVRYFHEADRDAAEEVARLARESFAGACRLRQPLVVRRLSLPAPPGNIEVWIGATEGQCQ